MDTKSGGPASTEPAAMSVKPRRRPAPHEKTVFAKGVWITDEPQQNQQDGEVFSQAGDDQQTTAQPS